MRKESEKKKWTRPELTVLVRNKPEEAVLITCHRGQGGGGTDKDSAAGRCSQESCGPDCFSSVPS
jgi:hypothetical protein